MSCIRILDEDRLSLEEARPLFGTAGKKSDFTTVYRAVTKGNLLPSGERLHSRRFASVACGSRVGRRSVGTSRP